MASLHRRQSGAFYIAYTRPDNGRKTSLGLGDAKKKAAESFLAYFNRLLERRELNLTLDPETARWLRDLPDAMNEKLASAGLAERRASKTLDEMLDALFEEKTPDLATSTIANYRQTRGGLESFFGSGHDLRSIGPADAAKFRLYMLDSDLAPATANRRVKRAKQFFLWAKRRGLIDTNPFEDITVGNQENRERMALIDVETIEKVIDAAPNASWRLIIALARYGGLRIPSEIRNLRWEDIVWNGDQSVMRIECVKTRRHEGHAERIVPIFSRLRPYLEDAQELAKEGEPLLFPWLKNDSGNFHTRFKRIIRRAGVKPWARLFQNLRASLATELADVYAPHVCEAWLGHSARIADKHYRQVHSGHIRNATTDETGAITQALTRTTEIDRERAQMKKPGTWPGLNSTVLQGPATHSTVTLLSKVPPLGLEPRTL